MWQAFNNMTGGLRGRNVLPSVHPEASLMLNSSYHLYYRWWKVSARLASDFYFCHMKKSPMLRIWLQSFYYFELVLTSCNVNYFKDYHWFSTCEVLSTSRPTEVVSKVINASVSQIRSWCVMTQWSAVRIYSVILMRMNLSCCLPETRRLKRSQMHLLFFCFARSSIKLQSCYCWYLNVSHAAAKRKCLDSAKRWIVLSSLGKSLLELGVGCAWWCRKGKIFSWFKLLLPSLTASRQKLRCKVTLGHLPLLLHPSSSGLPSSLSPRQACPRAASPGSRRLPWHFAKEEGGCWQRGEPEQRGCASALPEQKGAWHSCCSAVAERGWGNAHRAVVGPCDHDQVAGCEKRNQIGSRGYSSVGARWLQERVRQVLEAAVPERGMNICERLQHYRACFTAQLHF